MRKMPQFLKGQKAEIDLDTIKIMELSDKYSKWLLTVNHEMKVNTFERN